MINDSLHTELARLSFEADTALRVYDSSRDLDYVFNAMAEVRSMALAISTAIHEEQFPRPRPAHVPRAPASDLLKELGL